MTVLSATQVGEEINRAGTILLMSAGQRVPVTVRKTEARQSPHTGAHILRLYGEVRLSANDHVGLVELATGSKASPVPATTPAGTPIGCWSVHINQYSERNGIYDYVLLLDQQESIQISTLRVKNLSFAPYRYEERFSSDDLNIEAKIVVSSEQLPALRTLLESEEPVDVVREGISATPRKMRIAAYWWSANDGVTKFHLSLWDLKETTEKPLMLFTQFQVADYELAKQLERYDHLMTLLRQKNLISLEEIEAINKAAAENAKRRQIDFHHLRDVDLV